MPTHSTAATTARDVAILRELARRYLDVCRQPEQQARREHWRRLHCRERVPPPIYVRACAWSEMPASRCECQDPFLRAYENHFRHLLFQATLGDDFVFEPWVTVSAVHTCSGWGLTANRQRPDDPRGAWKDEYPLRDESDLDRLRPPCHGIDAPRTAARLSRLADALGDVLPVQLDRAPAYRMWTGDISTELGHLRGIENLMLDMMDRPAWLHRLLAFMRDGILAVHEQAEQAGDWGLAAHQNQAMPYAWELPDPAANGNAVQRRRLWGYMASQEYTLVAPEMWNEFLFEYQVPILEEFGLVAYGCCEDLTRKIRYLRRLPNLRRIGVAPAADVARCAEQIGTDYIISYRPSPADMVSYGFDEGRVRRIVTRDLERLRHCHFDITLKDVETVQGDPQRVRRWVEIVREAIDATPWA